MPEDDNVRINTTCVPVRVVPGAPTVVDRLPTAAVFAMEVEAVRADTSLLVAGHTKPTVVDNVSTIVDGVKHVHRGGDEAIAAREGKVMTNRQERT